MAPHARIKFGFIPPSQVRATSWSSTTVQQEIVPDTFPPPRPEHSGDN